MTPGREDSNDGSPKYVFMEKYANYPYMIPVIPPYLENEAKLKVAKLLPLKVYPFTLIGGLSLERAIS